MFNNRFKNFHWSFILLTIVFVFGLFFASQVIWAWTGPTIAPPNGNIAEPINRGSNPQDKTGTLILNNTTDAGLKMQSGSEIRFYDPNNAAYYMSLTAPSPFTGNTSYNLTLPADDGDNGEVLTTDGSGNLSWAAASGSDNDWTINGTYMTAGYNVRVGSGTPNWATDNDDLYVADTLEVNDELYVIGGLGVGTNPDATFKLRLGGHAGPNAPGIYDLGSDNRAWRNIYTNTVSLQLNNSTANYIDLKPAASLSGGYTLYFPLNDGTADGQVLTTDGSGNLRWDTPSGSADNDWTINGTYMTAGYNTRVGSGTPNWATGNDDLYVADTLEVNDELYAMGGLGVGTNPDATFKLRMAGNVGPNTNNTYDLGSASYRWANIYGGDSNLLNIKLPDTAADKSEGIIYYGLDGSSNPEPFIHNSGYSAMYLEHTNTYVGKGAGVFLDGVIGNTMNVGIGYKALNSINAGYKNTAVGAKALTLNSSGNYNSAFGDEALSQNTTGYNNDAFGYMSLFKNTSGHNNSAFGTLALSNNTTGSYNIGIGYRALYGNSSLTGSSNIGIGRQAGQVITTGTNNVFIGDNAGATISTGNRNIFLGVQAGVDASSGNDNVVLGYQAGQNNTGNRNIFIGSEAGLDLPGGNGNVMIGAEAGKGINVNQYNKFYLHNNNDDPNYYLMSGTFYDADNSDGVTNTDPFLRVNARLGVSPVNHNFTPDSDSLLHVYRNDGTNSEIKLQSLVDGANYQEHWGIYHDYSTKDLRFWNDYGDTEYGSGGVEADSLDNILTLQPDGDVGIGVVGSNLNSNLEIHEGVMLNNLLTLSNYNDYCVGKTSCSEALGANKIEFVTGYYTGTTYGTKLAAEIVSGFNAASAGSQSDPDNSMIKFRTLDDTGSMTDTITAQNVHVGIAGDINSNYHLTVHGATQSNDYYSGSNHQGITTSVCAAVLDVSSTPEMEMFFEDGLLVCASGVGENLCASCTLDYCLAGTAGYCGN